MLDDAKKDLSAARWNAAEEALAAAKTLCAAESYKAAANRSYYAVFLAMRAILAYDEVDMKRHSGVISEFRRRYIKTGIFDMEMSTIISDLFNIRTDSDYDDFFVIAKEDVAVQIQNAETFLAQAKALLAAKGTFQ